MGRQTLILSPMHCATSLPAQHHCCCACVYISQSMQQTARCCLQPTVDLAVRVPLLALASFAMRRLTDRGRVRADVHLMNEVTLHRGREPHLTMIDAFVDGRHLTQAIVRALPPPYCFLALTFLFCSRTA